jgi:hypothetical protein
MSAMDQRFTGFSNFYPYYLAEHRSRGCRILHFAGTTLALTCLVAAVLTRNIWFLVIAPVAGYGCAWFGHILFEKNRPATFSHPWYSLRGDFAMYRDLWTGRQKF